MSVKKGKVAPHLVHADFVESSRSRHRLEGSAGEIMLAARLLFENKGVAKTTVKDIAEEAHITRELFYYYFDGKPAVVDAVMDDFVEDLVESALVWNEFREFGDMRGSLRKCIEAFRRSIQDQDGPRPMFAVLDELGRRDEFRIKAVRKTVDALEEYSVSEYALYRKIEISHVREMFSSLLFGLVGVVRMDPDISNEALMAIVEQTLHLDMARLDESTVEGGSGSE